MALHKKFLMSNHIVKDLKRIKLTWFRPTSSAINPTYVPVPFIIYDGAC